MKLITILCVLFLTACSDKECCVFPDTTCYSFDVRSCSTDLFANAVTEDASIGDREQKMIEWLTTENIEVTEIKLVVGFHEAVCEACDICPMGDRYFIGLFEEISLSKAEKLRLLSFQVEEDCF